MSKQRVDKPGQTILASEGLDLEELDEDSLVETDEEQAVRLDGKKSPESKTVLEQETANEEEPVLAPTAILKYSMKKEKKQFKGELLELHFNEANTLTFSFKLTCERCFELFSICGRTPRNLDAWKAAFYYMLKENSSETNGNWKLSTLDITNFKNSVATCKVVLHQ
jgi:hypothetical protein